MSYWEDDRKQNVNIVKTRLAVEFYSPPWSTEDRQSVLYIQGLDDSELAKALLNRDPKIRSKIGRFANPTICSYLEHHRSAAVAAYQKMFYSM